MSRYPALAAPSQVRLRWQRSVSARLPPRGWVGRYGRLGKQPIGDLPSCNRVDEVLAVRDSVLCRENVSGCDGEAPAQSCVIDPGRGHDQVIILTAEDAVHQAILCPLLEP